MFKRYLITAFMIIISLVINAQDVDTYLKTVSENNPEITAYGKMLEARKTEAATGLTPPDPSVYFGYLPGNTSVIGTKKIWSVNQTFSFPTKYLMQKRVNRSTVILAEEEFKLEKMMIMLDAELTLFDLIYYQETLNALMFRMSGYNNLQSAWKKMVDFGETSILDYNKIVMELSSLNLKISMTEAEIVMLKTKLNYLNDNSSAIPENIGYPLHEEPDLDKLLFEKSKTHPSFIIPEKEYQLSISEYNLSKTGSLPEFQVGYNSEIIPGETYSGPVAGLTIPLWSNSNRIKLAAANSDHSAAVAEAELLRLRSEVVSEFTNSKALRKSIDEISAILLSGDNKRFLDIALNKGEISLTTYFSDIEVMFQVEDRLLELKLKYNKSLAKLFDHQLLILN